MKISNIIIGLLFLSQHLFSQNTTTHNRSIPLSSKISTIDYLKFLISNHNNEKTYLYVPKKQFLKTFKAKNRAIKITLGNSWQKSIFTKRGNTYLKALSSKTSEEIHYYKLCRKWDKKFGIHSCPTSLSEITISTLTHLLLKNKPTVLLKRNDKIIPSLYYVDEINRSGFKFSKEQNSTFLTKTKRIVAPDWL